MSEGKRIPKAEARLEEEPPTKAPREPSDAELLEIFSTARSWDDVEERYKELGILDKDDGDSSMSTFDLFMKDLRKAAQFLVEKVRQEYPLLKSGLASLGTQILEKQLERDSVQDKVREYEILERRLRKGEEVLQAKEKELQENQELLAIESSWKKGFGRLFSAEKRERYEGLKTWRDVALRGLESTRSTVEKFRVQLESKENPVAELERCKTELREIQDQIRGMDHAIEHFREALIQLDALYHYGGVESDSYNDDLAGLDRRYTVGELTEMVERIYK